MRYALSMLLCMPLSSLASAEELNAVSYNEAIGYKIADQIINTEHVIDKLAATEIITGILLRLQHDNQSDKSKHDQLTIELSDELYSAYQKHYSIKQNLAIEKVSQEEAFFSKLKNNVNTFAHKSGLYFSPVFKSLSNERPTSNDSVTFHLAATTLTHSSIAGIESGGTLIENKKVNAFFKGIRLALKSMHVGERTIFYIPSKLAYGNTPPAGLKPSQALILDITLLSIDKQQ